MPSLGTQARLAHGSTFEKVVRHFKEDSKRKDARGKHVQSKKPLSLGRVAFKVDVKVCCAVVRDVNRNSVEEAKSHLVVE